MHPALKRIPNSRSWARYAIYADHSIIVLNKPPGLICQGLKSQGEVGNIFHQEDELIPSVFRFPRREMSINLTIYCMVGLFS